MVKTATLWLSFYSMTVGQEPDLNDPPSIKSYRAEENYDYLKSEETNPYRPSFGDKVKYIGLNKDRSIYFSTGGQYRIRFDNFTNKDWTVEDDWYYSQRIAFFSNFVFGKKIRLFVELYHGFTTSQNRIFEDDAIDLHQGFLEMKLIDNEKDQLSIRLGRQEIGYGASRLIGIREGPNIRRNFDLGRLIYKRGNFSMDLIYGNEVDTKFFAFDNRSRLFGTKQVGSPTFWGVYIQGPSPLAKSTFDIYYLSFQTVLAEYSDVVGQETRHTIGIRHFGSPNGRLSYNTELIYQFGELEKNLVRAFNFETDWKFKILTTGWKPTLGIKLDWSSGDRTLDDGKIQTFNPLFVNPAIYSLAGVNTPANLTSLHPSFTIYPFKGLSIYVDYAFFYRSQPADGLYSPPRFQTRMAGGISDRHIGDVIGLQVYWNINRNLEFVLISSYFLAGGFIEKSGSAENTFYISPTVGFKF